MFEDLTINRSTAIIEIVIMLLIAFILGFILAWILKRVKNTSSASKDNERSELDRLKENNRSLSANKIRLESDIQGLQNKLKACEDEKINQQKSVVAPVKGDDFQAEINLLKENNKSLSADKIKLQSDLKDSQQKLELCEAEKSNQKSSVTVNPANIANSDAENARKLGFKAVTSDRKDDLTKISGVGPFIEKKLNGLGIYTFEQISEFTPDTIEKVTKAIEFFPGRIQRDNWVKQAEELK